MRHFRLLLFILLMPLCAFLGNWENGESAKVTRVIDGDSLVLNSGLIVRLAQIEAPQIRYDTNGGNQSRQFLESLVLGNKVTLKYGGLRRDKMGRALAQVFVNSKDGEEIWVNVEILRAGFARVHTYIDNRKDVGVFWAAEREARKNLKGIWGDPKYQVRFADNPALIGAEGTFQLVEGQVTKAINKGNIIKLCFGDPQTDFCALIPKASWELFDGGIDGIMNFEGWRLRIRGRIAAPQAARKSEKGKNFEAHGPQIWLDHPEQIEFIIPK